ncbi:MAG: holo-ACP synthase [Elusimicrobiota bacterium]
MKSPAPALGIDIVEVPRISRLIHKDRFLKRVFSAAEVAYCRSKKNAAQHFAVRFAAKEAVFKALGRPGVTHKHISIRNEASGRPGVVLSGPFKRLEKNVSVTLSHTARYAVAAALFRR